MNNIGSCLFLNSVYLYPLSFTDCGDMEKDICIDAIDENSTQGLQGYLSEILFTGINKPPLHLPEIMLYN